MIAGKRIIGPVVTSVVFFVAMWTMDDFRHDRVAVNATFAVLCGIITYFLERWFDRRPRRKERDDGSRRSFGDIIDAIRTIIRRDRTP
jgi:hypothetical protein